jgi:hypothetical protein
MELCSDRLAAGFHSPLVKLLGCSAAGEHRRRGGLFAQRLPLTARTALRTINRNSETPNDIVENVGVGFRPGLAGYTDNDRDGAVDGASDLLTVDLGSYLGTRL